ncbi:Uncharacterised protein [Vibrio cincinnatiensis]|nr:Uncharacterised protein [Vibrio cincinnatiensis]
MSLEGLDMWNYWSDMLAIVTWISFWAGLVYFLPLS